ncbi:hypothetical protein ETB97_003707 [Aspergillus alliaceus]|uniref:Cytochrome P450 n=1 Tax=Petromyces alliaceus TaxID=209559 RepID=A0A8H6AD00_PETAA|nr:hypothetical protein ETB97_003707 [Aspergillus burnettii]
MRTQFFARPFLKSELRRVWELVIREKVQLAVSQILQDLKVDGKPDLLKWWMFLATDRMTGNASFSIFAGMVQESEKSGSIITDEDMASEAGSLIVAGVDTTAANLTCLIWAVLPQPKL